MNSQTVHSAEFTKTVNCSLVRKERSSSLCTSKASGAWNCNWDSIEKLCTGESL
jgi:hypothetical protein